MAALGIALNIELSDELHPFRACIAATNDTACCWRLTG
jgi:hypothetical protein